MKLEKFLKKAHEIILNHIDDEDFNVAKLAQYLNLSRSQTLRKIKASTGFSINEYIREVRLRKAVELLKDENLTISEISYRVGFNNPSYFNKCFHERFKHTPGDYREMNLMYEDIESPTRNGKKKVFFLIGTVVIFFLLIWWHQVNYHIYNNIEYYSSIAIFPIQDYSKNQDIRYFTFEFTDAITSELNKIKGLRVISIDSALHYRDSLKTYKEIAAELNVDLLLEGALITEDEQLRVVMKLIDPTPTERHIWQNKYDKSSANLLQLATSISRQIAIEINAVVTMEKLNEADIDK